MSTTEPTWRRLSRGHEEPRIGGKLRGLARALTMGLSVPETWILTTDRTERIYVDEIGAAPPPSLGFPIIIRTSYGDDWSNADEVSGLGRSLVVETPIEWITGSKAIMESDPMPVAIFVQPAVSPVCSGFLHIRTDEFLGIETRASFGLETMSVSRIARGKTPELTGWFTTVPFEMVSKDCEYLVSGAVHLNALLELGSLNLEEPVEVEWVYDGKRLWIVQYQSLNEISSITTV